MALRQEPAVSSHPDPATDATFHYSDVGKRRIAELRGDDGRGRLFTSDLSVNEFMMVERAGFEPLGLVMASSVYHIGYQPQNYKVSQELKVLSQGMYAARELVTEFVTVGTTVKHKAGGAFRNVQGKPFTIGLRPHLGEVFCSHRVNR